MKQYKDILNQIKATRESIEAKTAEIMRLDYTEERRAAAQNGGYFNNKGYKEIHEAAEANADAIRKLSDEIYTAEVMQRILYANARAALIAEALPVILKACEPYSGKPYGEKTKEKIREEVKKAGYGFYFDGYKTSRINIYKLSSDGYFTNRETGEGTAAAYDDAGHIAQFLTDDNKLNIANVVIKAYSDKYTEKPAQAARKTAKAIKAYQEATKALESQRRDLCDLLPAGLKEPEYIKEYYLNF